MKNNIVNLSHISYLRKFSDRKIHSSPVTPFFHVISINTNMICLVSYFSKDNAIPFNFLFATKSTAMVFYLVVQNIIMFSYSLTLCSNGAVANRKPTLGYERWGIGLCSCTCSGVVHRDCASLWYAWVAIRYSDVLSEIHKCIK